MSQPRGRLCDALLYAAHRMAQLTRRAPRVVLSIVALTVALCAGTGSAALAAAPYPPAAAVCAATPTSALAHAAVTLICTGLAPTSPVTVKGTGSAIASQPSGSSDSTGATTLKETVGNPGKATWVVTGVLPGGSSTSMIVSAAVIGATSGRASITHYQVGHVSLSSVAPGQSFIFSGCGYKPGSTVTITDTAGDSFGTAPVGADGCFSKKMSLSTPGDYTLVAAGRDAEGAVLMTTAHVTVEALELGRNGADAGGGGYAGGLAFTGADGIGVMVVLGAGLIAAGSGVVAAGRRRRLVRG